jgi:hypothetical protein
MPFARPRGSRPRESTTLESRRSARAGHGVELRLPAIDGLPGPWTRRASSRSGSSTLRSSYVVEMKPRMPNVCPSALDLAKMVTSRPPRRRSTEDVSQLVAVGGREPNPMPRPARGHEEDARADLNALSPCRNDGVARARSCGGRLRALPPLRLLQAEGRSPEDRRAGPRRRARPRSFSGAGRPSPRGFIRATSSRPLDVGGPCRGPLRARRTPPKTRPGPRVEPVGDAAARGGEEVRERARRIVTEMGWATTRPRGRRMVRFV